jgi:hypothetical protein
VKVAIRGHSASKQERGHNVRMATFDSNLKGGFTSSVALIDVRPVGKQRFNCLPVADVACFVKSNN